MIDDLRQKCIALSEKVRQLEGREGIEMERGRLAEDEIRRLRNNQQQLEGQLQGQGDQLSHYKAIVSRWSLTLEKAMPLLKELQKEATAGHPT